MVVLMIIGLLVNHAGQLLLTTLMMLRDLLKKLLKTGQETVNSVGALFNWLVIDRLSRIWASGGQQAA